LLARQIREPVRFVEAATALATRCDLLLEIGPGRMLTGLVRELPSAPLAVAVRAGDRSPRGLVEGAAAAHAAGARVRVDALYAATGVAAAVGAG
jgi:enediyne polyketide synthase